MIPAGTSEHGTAKALLMSSNYNSVLRILNITGILHNIREMQIVKQKCALDEASRSPIPDREI